MREANWVEVCGFWIEIVGVVMIAFGVICEMTSIELPGGENHSWLLDWVERRLRIPWLLQILITTVLGPIAMMVGVHMNCVGGGGRYPGYPLDVIIRWIYGS